MGTNWKSEEVAKRFERYNDMLENILGYSFLFHVIKSDESIHTILDYGCGSGKVSAGLAALNSAYRIIAADESEAMLNIAREKRKHRQIAYHLIRNDSLAGFDDSSIDCAIACFILSNNSNIGRIQRIIKEIYRVIKPKGSLFILEHNPQAIGIDFLTFRNGDGRIRYVDGSPKIQYLKLTDGSNFIRKDYYWTREFYENMMYRAGFELQTVAEPKICDMPIDDRKHFENQYKVHQWENETQQAPFIIFQSIKKQSTGSKKPGFRSRKRGLRTYK